jgi:hypothetical protein
MIVGGTPTRTLVMYMILRRQFLVRVMLYLMPRCVAGTEMIAGGTPTRTLVMYMVVLGLNAPVGVAIGQIIQQI